MEKRYQIQFRTYVAGEPTEWMNRMDSPYPFTEVGLAAAIEKIRELGRNCTTDSIKFRLVVVTMEEVVVTL